MSRSASPTNNFRDLRATFETRSQPTTATAYRSIAGDLASNNNMSTQQPPTRRVPSLAKSIDSVLDTAAATPSTRPTAKLRPSWIGPKPSERPATPGLQAMKQAVTVEYSSPGLQPPVYICTSLSDPQWEPVEMHREMGEHGGYLFSKAFEVDEGEYQYKFRLGEGDWWVCDESKAMLDDGQGNKNNLVVVKADSVFPKALPKDVPHNPDTAIAPTAVDATHPPPTPVLTTTQTQTKPQDVGPLPKPVLPPIVTVASDHAASAPAPLMKHETFQPPKGSAAEQTPERDSANPLDAGDDGGDLGDSHQNVLLSHETFKTGPDEESDPDSEDDSSSSSSEGEDEQQSNVTPRGRKESSAKSSEKQPNAPLLRHESIYTSPAKTPSRGSMSPKPGSGSNSPSSPTIPEEASPGDSGLEMFPSHHAGIIEKILDAHQRLPQDESVHDYHAISPFTHSHKEVASPPRLRAAAEEVLEKIREAEEEEVEKEQASGEELDPGRRASPITPPLTPQEPEDAGFAPQVSETKVEIEEHIVVEIVDERKSVMEVLLDRIGGKNNAIAVAVGLLVIATGIWTMQWM